MLLEKILRFSYWCFIVLTLIFLISPIKKTKQPEVGEVWEWCLNEKNPFEDPLCKQYKILDVKKHPKAKRAYVLYREKDSILPYNMSSDVIIFEDYKCVENCK